MFEQYNLETSFEAVAVGKTFVYKALFGSPVLYKKIAFKESKGCKYNAEQVKPGLKKYEYFEAQDRVRVIK